MKSAAPLKLLFTWKPHRGLDQIRACMDGLEIMVSDNPTEIMALIPDVEVLNAGHFDATLLQAAKKLRWVHAFSGGVNHLLFPELVQSRIPVTCLKGCFDIAAAEYALAVMLAFSRKLGYDIRQRAARTFVESEPTELSGKTVGIIGLGNMGLEIARRCRCFGMRVIGLARQPRACPPEVSEMLTPAEIPRLLTASDFVVVAVPMTAATKGMIGTRELAGMKKSAYLIDVSGRPSVYDLGAVSHALRTGGIAGANLQMVPATDSPLWEIDNLLLAFHRIVSYEQYDRCVERFCENLRRYRDGRPLLGLVDKVAGY